MNLLNFQKSFAFFTNYKFSGPKGLSTSNNLGKRVSTEMSANNIAMPVKTPKYIVGIKFERNRIEKPNTIVIEVFKIATPTVL